LPQTGDADEQTVERERRSTSDLKPRVLAAATLTESLGGKNRHPASCVLQSSGGFHAADIIMNAKKPIYLAVVFVAVAGLALAAVFAYSRMMGDRPYTVQPPATSEQTKQRSKEEIAAACKGHIDAAFAEAQQVATARATEFSAFVRSKKKGARPFAENVTSLYGKWRVVKPYLPFADGDGHKKYVEELFATHIFTKDELGARLQRTIEDAVLNMEGIQNRLAVKLRQEITGSNSATLDGTAVAAQFRKSIEQIVAASEWDAQKAAGALVVSEVVSAIGTQVLIRLGVSAGILGAGAANSWWSLGGSIVIGVVVDVLWEWIDDPTGDVEREVSAAIDSLAHKCDSALSAELQKVNQQKQDLWLKASDSMIAATK